MSEKIPWNFLRGCWKSKGCLPTGYKQYEPHFRNGTAGAASNDAVLATMTPAQRQAAEDAIRSRQAAGGGNTGASYSGADFQSMIEAYRDKKGCGYVTAFEAGLRTEQGQRAHAAYLKAKNPHAAFEE